MRRFLLRGLVVAAAAGGPAVVLADPPPRPAVAPLSDETLLAVLRAEKDAWTRRLEVCQRLREIAHDNNDDKLMAKANELEKQANAAYHERVSRLGVKSFGPLPPLPPATPDADATAKLDKALGSGVAKTPLEATKPANKSATAKVSQFKEVAP